MLICSQYIAVMPRHIHTKRTPKRPRGWIWIFISAFWVYCLLWLVLNVIYSTYWNKFVESLYLCLMYHEKVSVCYIVTLIGVAARICQEK